MPSYNFEIKRNVGRPTNYSKVLEGYGTDLIIWFQNYMQAHDRIATGDSISSFKLFITHNKMEIAAAESVAFALQGRKAGPFPNIVDIRKWIVVRGIDEKAKADPITGRIPTLNQLTFLISRKIALKGTDPPKLTPQNINAVISSKLVRYTQQLGEIQAEDVRQQFVDTFKRSRTYKVRKK